MGIVFNKKRYWFFKGYEHFFVLGLGVDMDIIKKRLSEEFKNSGLTTIEIARKIGVSPEMVTQYSTTKKLPKLDTFAKICKELDLDANYILGNDRH